MTGYLTSPAARYRHGLSVRVRYLPEGRLLVTSMLQPSVKAQEYVTLEPVPARTFGDVLALLAGGVVVGLLGWVFVVGLFAIGGLL